MTHRVLRLLRRVRLLLRLLDAHYGFGFFTSTVGTFTSVFFVPTVGRSTMSVSFVVPTVGVLIVSAFVPTSTVGVWTVSVWVPTTGFCTSYSPAPVFLHAASVATRVRAMLSLRIVGLR